MNLLLNRCDDVYLAVRAEGDTTPEPDDQMKADSYITLSQSAPEQDPDSSLVREEFCGSELEVLKVQLKQAEETAHRVQKEVPQAVCSTHSDSCVICVKLSCRSSSACRWPKTKCAFRTEPSELLLSRPFCKVTAVNL